ncbi:MAG: hypothetical protein PWQ25_309 [Deferribacteres bacterium]|nr:hypothetical protein [Deferribacteres bacterium]
MNYKVFIVGNMNDNKLIDIIKLILTTAEESDYSIKLYSATPDNPFSYGKICIELKGSNKEIYKNIIADFENAVIEADSLEVLRDENPFGLLGKLLKMIEDINPSYIIGYLLSKNMSKELEIFKGNFY